MCRIEEECRALRQLWYQGKITGEEMEQRSALLMKEPSLYDGLKDSMAHQLIESEGTRAIAVRGLFRYDRRYSCKGILRARLNDVFGTSVIWATIKSIREGDSYGIFLKALCLKGQEQAALQLVMEHLVSYEASIIDAAVGDEALAMITRLEAAPAIEQQSDPYHPFHKAA